MYLDSFGWEKPTWFAKSGHERKNIVLKDQTLLLMFKKNVKTFKIMLVF